MEKENYEFDKREDAEKYVLFLIINSAFAPQEANIEEKDGKYLLTVVW